MVSDPVNPGTFCDYVAERGYRTSPITNSIEAAQEGAPIRIMGYTLIGPRGNKTVVSKDANGNLDIERAKLWCDSTDYATKRVNEKRAQKAAR